MCACVCAMCMLSHFSRFLLKPARLLCPWDSPGKILEWVAMPSSRGYTHTHTHTYIYMTKSKTIVSMILSMMLFH